MSVGDAVRAEFPIFEHAVYANSCSQGALANRVRAAAEEWLAGWDENGAEWEFWVERNEAARAAFAGLLHAEPDDVAVTTSVSQGVSALVSALDLSGERNRIVISEYEFPTVGQIAHAQELRGAEVVHVTPEADGRIPVERFAEAIDERTALVCCTALSFRTGHRNDVSAIAELGHASGAIVLADSYQAIGAIEFDARTLGADVVTGGTVKYLLGTAGLGFMWVRDSLRAQLLPTQTGWFADEDIFAMSIADYSPHATARRFDSGTPPVPSLYPGVAGMELIAEVGVPAIEAHVRGSSTGSSPGSTSSARPSPRHAARTSTARSSASCRRIRTRSSTPSAQRTSSRRRATRTCGSRCTSTTSRPTSTGSSPRSRAIASSSPDELGGVGPGGLRRRRVEPRAPRFGHSRVHLLMIMFRSSCFQRGRRAWTNGSSPATIAKQSTQYAIGQCSSLDRRCANAWTTRSCGQRAHSARRVRRLPRSVIAASSRSSCMYA